MTWILIAASVLTAVVVAWFLWRALRHKVGSATQGTLRDASLLVGSHTQLPAEGLLVGEDVLRAAGSSAAALWDALELAAVPIALEYRPVSKAEISKYRAIPVNASVQQSLVKIVEAINPKGPTLFQAVLPKGAELVKAAGTEGFRGFSRTGGKTAHAVLKPAAASGAIAAGWPVLAVAGTVFAVDMVSQREQRAHQQRVEAGLARQDERYYVERIKDQRSADAQLTRAVSLMLDGNHPQIELALKSADDEFYRSQQFLEKYRSAIDGLVDEQGLVDYRQLEEALGGGDKDVEHFLRELHLARAAIAIGRKALITQAAAAALGDPGNPYAVLRRFLEGQADRLEQAEVEVNALTERLMQLELRGRWHDREKSITERQQRFRKQLSPSAVDRKAEVLYLATPSGELLQLLPGDEADASEQHLADE